MKKHNNSAMKSEPTSKRAKARGPVQRDTKEVLAELVETLRKKLDPKVEAGSTGDLSIALRCGFVVDTPLATGHRLADPPAGRTRPDIASMSCICLMTVLGNLGMNDLSHADLIVAMWLSDK